MAIKDQGGDAESQGVKLPDTLAIAILLFPGFLSERVSEYFSAGPKISDVQIVAAALAATVLNLLVALLIALLFSRKMRRLVADRGLSLGFLFARVDFLILVFVISIFNGLIWAAIDSSNVLFNSGVTQRASRADPWETVFRSNAKHEHRYFVRVVTKDLGVYHGSPLYYPQGGTDRTLVLDLAQWELGSGKADERSHPDGSAVVRCVPVGLDVHGKTLIPGDQILAVEFRPKTLIGGKCEYRCDIPVDSKRCP